MSCCIWFCCQLFLCVSLLTYPIFLTFFFFNDTATTEIYTLSLHDALPIYTASVTIPTRASSGASVAVTSVKWPCPSFWSRSEEHTSELQSQSNLVCRLLLEKKKTNHTRTSESTSASHRLIVRDTFRTTSSN